MSYLNTRPVYFGLEVGAVPSEPGWEFVEGTPSILNAMLDKGELDISVISCVEYARNWREYYVLPNLCIGADGDVKSVLFFSKRPLKELSDREVFLTRASLTSKTFIQLLLEELGASPAYREFTLGEEAFLNNRTDAILLIGDEALRRKKGGQYPVCIDLAGYWKGKTGYPFVFALWCARREVVLSHPEEVKMVWERLIESKDYSRERLEEIAEKFHLTVGLTRKECLDYLEGLDFDLRPTFTEGMKLFFHELLGKGVLKEMPQTHFFPPAG